MIAIENIYPVKISEEAYLNLEKYADLLTEHNKYMNLTAITKRREIRVKHFADCLSLLTL